MEESARKLLREEISPEEDELPLIKRVWQESKVMWVVAAPAIFTRASTFGINVTSQAFVGHIGSKELAAFALVFTVLIRFANGILFGMASALSTLCGQAYGARRYGMMGVYLQRSWIVLYFTSLLLLPLFFFTSPIMKMLGQDDSIADVAGTISLWSIAVIFAYVLSFTFQTFLQSQSKNVVISFLAAFSITIHPSKIWGLWSSSLFHQVSCCGFLNFCSLELWYNTILVLLTGSMKNAEVEIDALSICLNINGWEMMIAFGFLAAASVRVSNELGRGSSKAAKLSIVVTVATSFTIGFILFLFFLFYRERLAYIFTTNQQVAVAVGDLSPLLAFSILLNSVQPVLSGVAVGAGWQSIVAYVNIGCYYIIGIPVGVVLSKVLHLQVKGIWMGMLFGTLVQTIVLTIITCKTDWDEQVLLARRRVDRYSVDDEETDTVTSNA
ncbi:protein DETOXIFICATION 20-like isoform X4 [Prosopis cineraria]|uniref:protein DETOXIFICATION 20-like isoform X4 n=1 Tax=Prosopis cineraria TaxID=364024 RepID=UPI00240F1334|nr:protein DETOXIFICATION 20-like isoform X4 [Prosopis cineraria]